MEEEVEGKIFFLPSVCPSVVLYRLRLSYFTGDIAVLTVVVLKAQDFFWM